MKLKTLAPLDATLVTSLERLVFLNSRAWVARKAGIYHATLTSGLEGGRMQLAKRSRLRRVVDRFGERA